VAGGRRSTAGPRRAARKVSVGAMSNSRTNAPFSHAIRRIASRHRLTLEGCWLSPEAVPSGVPPWQERLFLPGPTPVPWSIAHAMARPMTSLGGPALRGLVERVETGVARMFGTQRAVGLSGSGTATLEAAVQGAFAPGDPVLAVVAGAFGARFARVAEAHGLTVHRLEVAYGEVPTAEAVAARVARTGAVGLLLTHNETSTGLLMPIADWIAAARKVAPDVVTVVDAISSVPSVPLDMDAIGVDIATAASQKGFMAPPGLGLVGVGPRGLAALKAERAGRMYFDLTAYIERHHNATPAVAHWFAMDESLRLLDAEGDAARHERHVRMGVMVRAAGRAMGCPPLAREDMASPTVTVLGLPDGVDARAVLAHAAERYGATLAGAMGPWAHSAVRIGHVGAYTPLDMVTAVAALEAAVHDLCAKAGKAPPMPAGHGVAAALEAMREPVAAHTTV